MKTVHFFLVLISNQYAPTKFFLLVLATILVLSNRHQNCLDKSQQMDTAHVH